MRREAEVAGSSSPRAASSETLTGDLRLRMVTLALAALGLAGTITVPLALMDGRERDGLATSAIAAIAVLLSIAGMARRIEVAGRLRRARPLRLTLGLAACTVVAADGPYSPSWWISLMLLLLLATVARAPATILASLLAAGCYCAGIVLDGASLLPAGHTRYLTAALVLAIAAPLARLLVEMFVRFVLLVHVRRVETIAREAQPRLGGAASLMRATLAPTVAEPTDAETRHRPDVGQAAARGDHARALLTPRQLEVVLLLREGLRQSEIASRLGISPRQVERHLTLARQRAGALTTAHLVALLVGGMPRAQDPPDDSSGVEPGGEPAHA